MKTNTKTFFPVLLALLTFYGCTRKTDMYATGPHTPDRAQLEKLVPVSSINGVINGALMKTGQFTWKAATDSMIWGALLYSDTILSIGYQPPGMKDLSHKIATIDINSPEWKAARKEVIDLIVAQEKKIFPLISANDIIVADGGNYLPVIDVKVTQFTTIQLLRQSPSVRYAEPVSYGDFIRKESLKNTAGITHAKTEDFLSNLPGDLISSLLYPYAGIGIGCSSNVNEDNLKVNEDYTFVFPLAKQSWNYPYHKIDKAWETTSGKGVKVMVIDVGVSPDQKNLKEDFNQGLSYGRSIANCVTLPPFDILGGLIKTTETPFDNSCGHGTKSASVCAAPRGINGGMVGVAYNADLVTVRASDDVAILGGRQVKGVMDAYIQGALDPDVKIISMSMGTPLSSGQIEDAVNFADGKGKLLFCAAGTLPGFIAAVARMLNIVVFPASMPNVTAITGMKDDLVSPCDDCFTGPKVDFSLVMEKTKNGLHPLSATMQGDGTSTFGGSSVATASYAGIAALIWSRYPAYTKEQILELMKKSGSHYLNRTLQFGWGIIDVNAAVQ